jgi:predicted nuclease with TOPRIM domain
MTDDTKREPLDMAYRLRQTRADMLGTADDQHYHDCHEAAATIERLEAERDKLKEQIRQLTDELSTFRLGLHHQENAKLKEALRIIAGEVQCADNLMSNADIARAALLGDSNGL